VIYPVGLVPDRYQWLLYLNPLTGVISVARGTLLDQGTVEPQLVLISVGVAIALFVFGFAFFKRSEPEFADII
jgi:lipopolysaccharide transport system permease protein